MLFILTIIKQAVNFWFYAKTKGSLSIVKINDRQTALKP